MCGRFANSKDLQRLISRFKFIVDDEGWFSGPRYNVAPTQEVLVLRQRAAAEGGAVIGQPMRWGLVPFWADDPSIGARMINARGESVVEKPAFRRAFASRRCLVPADGFFEWKKLGRGLKQPYHIQLRGSALFAFAGLWEEWRPKDKKDAAPLVTFTIITTEANDLVREIHDRMPVILRPEDEAAWLDPANADTAALEKLLHPYPAEAMEAIPVSALVNSPANDSPAVLEPLAIDADGGDDREERQPTKKPGRDDLQPKLF